MDLSKDELTAELRARLGGSLGMTRAKQDPNGVCTALEDMGILERMAVTVNTPIAWSDLLIERLKGGRGSAIKGQRRARHLENFVEDPIIRIFGESAYDARTWIFSLRSTPLAPHRGVIPPRHSPRYATVAATRKTGEKTSDVACDLTEIA
jgi:hypothetical protein